MDTYDIYTQSLKRESQGMGRQRRKDSLMRINAVILAVALGWAAVAQGSLLPQPESIVPNLGPCSGGTSVMISGEGFNQSGTTTVAFGGTYATDVVVNSGYGEVLFITCTTPAHVSGSVDIVVTNSYDGSGTLASGFTYYAAVESVQVADPLHVDVVFTMAMDDTAATTAANYTLSGSGQGTLSSHPASVTALSGTTYRLGWTTGAMIAGGDVTIAVADINDALGHPLGDPKDGTDVGGGVTVVPVVTSVDVHSALSVDVTFSEIMGSSAGVAANYTVSGSGQGSLSGTPATAALVSGSTYRLTWDSGEMVNGGDITITTANIHDAVGNAVGSPNGGTDAGAGIGTAPSVTDVNVYSATQVDVSFTEALGTGATVTTSYTLSGSGKGSLSNHPTSVAPQPGNVYRLTWNAGEMFNGGDITVTVANVEDVAGNPLGTPDSGADAGAATGVLPTVSSVTVSSGFSVDVVFSEAMQTGILNASNYTVSGSGQGTLASHPANVILYGMSTYRLVWNSGDMVNGGDVTITVANVTDTAGNPMGVPDSGTDAGGGVGVPPTLSSVDVQTGRSVDVTFNEAMDATALDAAHYVLSGSGQGTLTSNPDLVELVSGSTYRLTWDDGEMFIGGDITITAENVQDAGGNPIGSPNEQTDPGAGLGVAPMVAFVLVQSPLTVDVMFSEALGASGATATNYAISGSGKGTLTIRPASATQISDGVYRLEWASGEMVEDGDVTITVTNVSDLAGNSIGTPNSATDSGGGQGVAPEVSSVSVQSASSVDVVFSEAMGSTANSAANYTVSGTGQGSLAAHPSSVALVIPGTYRLSWSSGIMHDGGDLTITADNVKDAIGNLIGAANSGTDVGGAIAAHPNAISVTPLSTQVDHSAQFTVTFDKTVRHFNDVNDLAITMTGTVAYTSALVSGGPSAYFVSITGISGDGTMTLAVSTESDVDDVGGNALTSSVTSAVVNVGSSAPYVAVIDVTTANPTTGSTVAFAVEFSEAVAHFDGPDDLVITSTGTAAYSGAAISGGPQDYTVTLAGVAGDGTLQLAVDTASGVQDLDGNALTSSPDSDEVVLDHTSPGVASVTAITPSPTSGTTVSFSVTFTEDVTGFDAASDLALTETGVAHTGVSISGGPMVYTVDVTGVSGNGSLMLAVNAGAGIEDLAGNPLAAHAASATVVVDQLEFGAWIQLQSGTPTGADQIVFEVTFSKPVAPTFTAEDLVLASGSLDGTVNVIGADPTYIVTVTLIDPDADGTVGIELLEGGVTDSLGSPCPAASSPLCSVYNWHGFGADPEGTEGYVGDPVTFDANPLCGSPSLSYQWKWDNGGKAVQNVGGNEPQFTLPHAAPSDNGDYWCEVSYDGETHLTAKATLDVKDHLEVAVPLQNGVVPREHPYTFSVATTGGFLPLEYTWKKDGNVLSTEKGSAFTIPSAAAEDAGAYTVEIADANGDLVMSGPVTLTIGEGMPVTGFAGLAMLAGILALAGSARARRS